MGPAPYCGDATVLVESGSGCDNSDVEDEKARTCWCLAIVGLGVVVENRGDEDEASDGKSNFSLERLVGVIGGGSDREKLIMGSIDCREFCAARFLRTYHHAKNAARATRADAPVATPMAIAFPRSEVSLYTNLESYHPFSGELPHLEGVSVPAVGEGVSFEVSPSFGETSSFTSTE